MKFFSKLARSSSRAATPYFCDACLNILTDIFDTSVVASNQVFHAKYKHFLFARE